MEKIKVEIKCTEGNYYIDRDGHNCYRMFGFSPDMREPQAIPVSIARLLVEMFDRLEHSENLKP